jgi:S1-C subfamily serine protease
VLVTGGYIVTAAHCIECTAAEGMLAAMGSGFHGKAQTAAGRELLLDVLAIEPVADIAILGSPDNQAIPDEAETFAEFIAATKPVPLYRGKWIPTDVHETCGPGKYTLPALVYNLDRSWVKATASVVQPGQPMLFLESERHIECGASGGPIVTPDGQLIGVVSHGPKPTTRGKKGPFNDAAARPLFALPVWAVEAIGA